MLLSFTRASLRGQTKKGIFWIGQKCWPSPHLLYTAYRRAHQGGVVDDFERFLRSECILVDPPDKEARVWAIIQTLRTPGVLAVVADTSGLPLQALRRIQLAAEAGNVLGICLRAPWEKECHSPSYSKWCIRPYVSQNFSTPTKTFLPAWRLELLRLQGSLQLFDKGAAQPRQSAAPYSWTLVWKREDNNGTGAFSLAHELQQEEGVSATSHSAVA